MDLKLLGSVVFLAGSSRGIGRAIAAALLEEGARVVLTGRDAGALARTHEELSAALPDRTSVLAIAGDLSVPENVIHALGETIRSFGRLDHLVANLGTGAGRPGWQQPEAEWARLFEANLFTSIRVAQASIPYLRESTSASILFISSIVALEATEAPLPYSAAKAALTNYSKNLSRLLAPEKIRVNTICPGNILFAGGSWERKLADHRDAVEAMLVSQVPQKRFGTPEEVASLAAWLCSPRAAFTTGSTFVIDGGQTRAI